jgi:hypothetical protein
MKEKLYSIKRKFTGLGTDKFFRASKRTLLNKERRQPESRRRGEGNSPLFAKGRITWPLTWCW